MCNSVIEYGLLQAAHAQMSLSPSSLIWCRRKLGSKQAHRAIVWTRARGIAATCGWWPKSRSSAPPSMGRMAREGRDYTKLFIVGVVSEKQQTWGGRRKIYCFVSKENKRIKPVK